MRVLSENEMSQVEGAGFLTSLSSNNNYNVGSGFYSGNYNVGSGYYSGNYNVGSNYYSSNNNYSVNTSSSMSSGGIGGTRRNSGTLYFGS